MLLLAESNILSKMGEEFTKIGMSDSAKYGKQVLSSPSYRAVEGTVEESVLTIFTIIVTIIIVAVLVVSWYITNKNRYSSKNNLVWIGAVVISLAIPLVIYLYGFMEDKIDEALDEIKIVAVAEGEVVDTYQFTEIKTKMKPISGIMVTSEGVMPTTGTTTEKVPETEMYLKAKVGDKEYVLPIEKEESMVLNKGDKVILYKLENISKDESTEFIKLAFK